MNKKTLIITRKTYFSLSEKKKKEIIKTFVNLHFSGLFDETKYNKRYLKARFTEMFRHEDTILVLVKEKGMPLGMVYGMNSVFRDRLNSIIMKNNFIKLFSLKVLFNRIFKRGNNLQHKKIKTSEEDWFRLVGIVVVEAARNRNIGSLLLNKFEEVVNSESYHKLILKSPTFNKGGIDFYLRNNYYILSKDEHTTHLAKNLKGGF